MELALAVHAAGFVAAALYLAFRLRPYFSATWIMLAALLVLHGPAYLYYVFAYGPDTLIFEKVLAVSDGERALVDLTLALGLVFAGVAAGAELAARLWARQATGLARAVLQAGAPPSPSFDSRALVPVAAAVAAAMGLVSLIEDHPGKLVQFLAVQTSDLDKAAARRELAGSGFYLYNLLLYAVAPFIAIVMVRLAWRERTRASVLAALALLGAVAVGKLATLSKAPLALFLLQMLIAFAMARSLRIRIGQTALLVGVATFLFGAVSLVAIPGLDPGAVGRFLFYRALMIPNEVLVEYFAVVPDVIPHAWGAHFPTASALFGMPFEPVPAYTAVAEVSRGNTESTSNAMFVGDAWSDFGWAGVVLFPVLAGFVVRGIDVYAFRNGKTEEAIALVAGATYGVFTLLVTALNTALLSGGLALLPLVSWLLVSARAPRGGRVPEGSAAR